MKRVLVVEDDPQNALVFRKLLERRGSFAVTVTESAEEVLAAVRGRLVDLVIMDISLANTRLDGAPLSGVQLCRLIKQEPLGANIPVVLATAHAMRGDAEAFLEQSGANAYVAKPILDHAGFVGLILSLLEAAA